MIEQLSLFPEARVTDPRPPETVTWNGIHGCTKHSTGCLHCYMFRRDESVGKDPTVVRKNQNFNLPVRQLRAGHHKGLYKIPAGSHIYTCFSSDFFHKDADEWRPEMWDMIRERSDCTFFMITKRPERIEEHLPPDWNDGWNHVTIAEEPTSFFFLVFDIVFLLSISFISTLVFIHLEVFKCSSPITTN